MQEHFNFALKMIIAVKPKIIIVCNTLVRDILLNKTVIKSCVSFSQDAKSIYSKLSVPINEKYGTPIINKLAGQEDIPIFFTSMLSGQRALDLGSFDRLIWHINFIRKLHYSEECGKYTE